MANQEQLDILKQGVETWNQWRKEQKALDLTGYSSPVHSVETWNQWRKEHQDRIPDLSKADLSGANLDGAFLLNADLRETLQPHFLITAIERKLFSLSSTCCEHIVEMSRIFIGKVYMGSNQIFPMVCRNRAWSGHRT